MISSTFFDLKQVRADLARFLSDELGCKPLVSEWPSFPIDPDVDTVENCRRRVERDADILVLVIGGRYGSVDSKSSKSVTNLEYLAARAKGIPVYVFVEKKILGLLPVWKANQGIAFHGVVDDTRIFGFIEEIRDLHKVWMNEFDLADDIVEALRWQLAYLILQGSRLVQRSRSDREYAVLRELQGIPLRIALERPKAWEYRLFGEILIQEIHARRALSEQKKLGLVYGAYQWLDLANLNPWAKPRMAELSCLIQALKTLVNEEFRKAIGAPGEPGDIELLVFTARSLAELYQEGIEWGLRVRRTVGEESVTMIVERMSHFVDDILGKIEAFGPLILQEINDLLGAADRGEPTKRSILLDLQIPGVEEAIKAFDRLTQQLEKRMS